MPAVVTLPFVCSSPPEVQRRVRDAVARVMSPMAIKRTWALEVTSGGAGKGPMEFSLKGFARTDPETMKADRSMQGLSQDDLRAIYGELHEHFHGDEHG